MMAQRHKFVCVISIYIYTGTFKNRECHHIPPQTQAGLAANGIKRCVRRCVRAAKQEGRKAGRFPTDPKSRLDLAQTHMAVKPANICEMISTEGCNSESTSAVTVVDVHDGSRNRVLVELFGGFTS